MDYALVTATITSHTISVLVHLGDFASWRSHSKAVVFHFVFRQRSARGDYVERTMTMMLMMHSDTYRREGVHRVSRRSVVLVCVNVSRQRG